MPLTVTVDLLTGSYDAADALDKRHPEWPPHPARLFCALVSAARSEEERQALRWLEARRPPKVWAARRVETTTRESYVVTNTTVDKGGNLTYPGRSNQLRSRVRSCPSNPRVRFVWPEAEADPRTIAFLDDMARRVPYLGRSTGISLLAASATVESGGDCPSEGSPWVLFEPCAFEDSQVRLRVPYPGYLDELDEVHAAGRSAWEVSHTEEYRIREAAPKAQPAGAVSSVYPDVIVFRFAGLRPEGRLAVRFTEALRKAVLSLAGEGAPEVLHGHDANGRPHVAFLALPNVGNEHADGNLLGLAVAIPELPAEQRRPIVGAVLGLRRSGTAGVALLNVRDLGQVELLYQPGLVRPWGATPDRWRQGGRRWSTATPIVLDRFPHRGESESDVIAESIRKLGLPDPVRIRINSAPMLPGAVRLRPLELPEKAQRRPFRHVELTFDRPVAGPLLIGAGRYLGVGLLAPIADGSSTVEGGKSR